jgi:hypothetical protein
MKIKLDIGNRFSQTVICISLILLMSSGFSFAGARADGCRGDADCLFCVQQAHLHLPGVQMITKNSGCTPTGRNSSCGFEAAQGAEKVYGIASAAVRLFQPVRSVIFTGAADEDSQFHLSRGLSAPFFQLVTGPKAPIYLRNHSLLC